MHITIIGVGYVGLVTGTCLSKLGFNVRCLDKDSQKIHSLKNGVLPIYEPGIQELLQNGIELGRLSFTSSMAEAAADAAIIFITVGTPTNGSGADLKDLFSVAGELAPHLNNYKLIVIKSTVPPGTSKKLREFIYKVNPNAIFDVAMNPEFLKEGCALNDFMQPDRIVLGTSSSRASILLQTLYHSFSAQGVPLLKVSLETAEMIKYASNAFLATKIAFINEISDLCEECHADIDDVAEGMGLDKRIGSQFLKVGPGFGGSCFPKDITALTTLASSHGKRLKILEAVIASNRARRKKDMYKKIINSLEGSVEDKVIAILGVTFKSKTDDVRESPSLDIMQSLTKQNAQLQAYDPYGMEKAKAVFPQITWCPDAYTALKGAHAAVIATEWEEFLELNFEHIKLLMAIPLIIDLRNLYAPNYLNKLGFSYVSLGRSPRYHPNSLR